MDIFTALMGHVLESMQTHFIASDIDHTYWLQSRCFIKRFDVECREVCRRKYDLPVGDVVDGFLPAGLLASV
jgi:hypothetical protein